MARVTLSPSLRLVAAAVLLAGGIAFAPERAAASCGDYVTVNGSHPATPASADRPADEPPGPRPPCQGPGCSNRPDTPAPLPTVPVTSPSDSKEGVTRFVAGQDGDRDYGWVRTPTSDGRAVRRPLAIFHPPRAV